MLTLDHHKETIKGNAEPCIGKKFPCSMEKESFPIIKEKFKAREVSNIIEPKHPPCKDFIASSNKFPNKQAYQHDFASWPVFYPESQKIQQCQNNIGRQFYHPSDNQYQCVPLGLSPQGYPHDYQIQEFLYFVVIDFEATCDKENIPHPQEIIEFPSVIVNSHTGQIEAWFQTYVKPTCNQLLSDFCKDLTGIQQTQVDRGIPLNEAIIRHDKWLENRGIKNANFVVVTWSNWDCSVMMESECRFKKIRKPSYFNRWINLKIPFREVFGDARCNLKEAVQLAGLTWQGRPHCGLDDAKNTARLLSLLMHKGFKFSITNSLIWQQTSDFPLTLNHYQNHLTYPAPQSSKPKDLHIPQYQFYPICFCGVKSSKGMIRKPGPTHGNLFFGCGNWTAGRGALCHYFEWASH